MNKLLRLWGVRHIRYTIRRIRRKARFIKVFLDLETYDSLYLLRVIDRWLELYLKDANDFVYLHKTIQRDVHTMRALIHRMMRYDSGDISDYSLYGVKDWPSPDLAEAYDHAAVQYRRDMQYLTFLFNKRLFSLWW